MNEQHLELLARLGFAMLVGGIIGWERKIRGKPVGIITNMLVCIGATILAIYQQLSTTGLIIYGFDLIASTPNLAENDGRIVAQIVSGIGFLGAGTIMRYRHSDEISGITTAATLWIMACLGIVIGSGYWFLSLISSIVIIIVLFFVKGFVNRFLEHKKLVKINIICKKNLDLETLFSDQGLKIINSRITKISIDKKTIQVKIFVPSYINIEKILEEIKIKMDTDKIHFIYKISD